MRMILNLLMKIWWRPIAWDIPLTLPAPGTYHGTHIWSESARRWVSR